MYSDKNISLWKEGKTHVKINKLYYDVVCPNDCDILEKSTSESYFTYCKYCKKGLKVCDKLKNNTLKYGKLP